jgi:non-ribosomal peptide synthetase component F
MSAPDQTGPTKAETLRGGTSLSVDHSDGTTSEILVRQLPVRDFERWLGVMDDEPRVVELFAERPEGWGDTLTPASLELVVTEGERVNRDFFERWLQRRLARKEWLAPLLARNAAVAGSLPTGLPNSPLNPD